MLAQQPQHSRMQILFAPCVWKEMKIHPHKRDVHNPKTALRPFRERGVGVLERGNPM